MDEAIIDILENLSAQGRLGPAELDRIIRKHSKRARDGRRVFAKKHLLARYLQVKEHDPELFKTWGVDDELNALFVSCLQMKPRRTASGVATITVITKPWPCKNSCIYCPNDIRMPKSYLHDEPACQRAERNYFDPYLQVSSRLKALGHMGHATEKVELIVLGGTWTDYPLPYRIWFVRELFRALNDTDADRLEEILRRTRFYEDAGMSNAADVLQENCSQIQARIDSHEITFNEAWQALYGTSKISDAIASFQRANYDDLTQEHQLNETGLHRVVGLVIETRPGELSCDELVSLRRLGCTKIQMGIQSLDEEILKANGRESRIDDVKSAMALTRLFGFKTHVHFMANLYGSTPERDACDYEQLVRDPAFLPDEVKLYPCALVAGTPLVKLYENGLWRPYTEEELVGLLCADMLVTPPYMRVSRMIRDISAKDILAGNKKTNLRQMVERALQPKSDDVEEIRFREIATDEVVLEDLSLVDYSYHTSVSTEHFLQWVTPENKIAGFLRLSLPCRKAIDRFGPEMPIKSEEAMIREVHIYGFAAKLAAESTSAQHHGLGKALVNRACSIASDAGYTSVNVISAVGTREYYRNIGFVDNGLYQRKPL